MRERTRSSMGTGESWRDDATGPPSAQPRPALGLRPWFAFLRRARNLRLFAFAMAQRVPGRAERPRIGARRSVVLVGGGWRSSPLLVATSFRQRLRGVTSREGRAGVVLWGSSVRGARVAGRFDLVGLDADGVVVAVRPLTARPVTRLRGATVVAEVPAGAPLPAVGDRIRRVEVI